MKIHYQRDDIVAISYRFCDRVSIVKPVVRIIRKSEMLWKRRLSLTYTPNKQDNPRKKFATVRDCENCEQA